MAYRIRKKLRELEGTFEEAQIVKQILRGKLSGDDEFRRNDLEPWSKLSSRPVFYDALLKHLFQEQYPVDSDSIHSTANPNKPASVAEEQQPTRQEKGTKTRQTPDAEKPGSELEGTMALSDDKREGTLHQAEIDELFSEPKPDPNAEASADEEEKSKALAVTLVGPNPFEDANAELPPINVKLENPLPKKFFDLQKRRPSKKVLIACGVLLLLVLLFQFDGGSKKPVADNSTKKATPELYVSLTDPKIKRETLEALARQGDILYEMHTPLFYLGAQEAYGQALLLDETNVVILGALSESSARLVPESSGDEGIDEQVKQFVARGRAKEPHYASFYRAEALLALYQNNLARAQELIRNALEVDPANLENDLVQAEIFIAGNELQGAQKELDKVIKEAPVSIQAHHLLSSILVRKKEYEAAKKEAISVLKLNPIHAGSYFNLANIAFAEDKVNEAERHYATFTGLAKFAAREDLYRAYVRLGLLQENRGRKKEAQDNYRLAIYYVPEKRKELEAKLEGAPEDENSLMELVGKSEYGVGYFRERGETLALQKNFRHSLIFLHAAHLLSPNDGSGLVRIADISEKLADNYTDFRAVTSYYERAIEKEPTLVDAYIKLGLLETDLYNLDRAFNLLKHALTLAPNQAEPYIALGKYYFKARDYNASLTQFSEAFKYNGSNPEIFFYLGKLRMLGKANAEKDAMEIFNRAYLGDSNFYEAMIEWLKLKVKVYDKLFAIKFVRNLIDQDPGNPKLYWAMGEVYAANKEHRRAIDYYKKALELDRYLSGVRLSFAKSLEAVGELERAVDEYRIVTRLDRRNGEGAFRASEILLEANRFDLSEQVLNELLLISPSYPGANRNLAKISQAKRKKDLAISYMQKEVKNNPLNSKFRIELSQMLMDYQEYENAITELTEVTNLGDKFTEAHLKYDKIRAYLLLSRCYRALNRFESAEGSIGLALEIDEKDPELHRELGYVYYGQQRPKEAAKELRYYLERNPAASDAQNIKTIIDNMVIDE